MAKKRRKKKSIASNLKYEVYGILLITVSVIALSGGATVGRSLSKLFGLFLGKFYFVLALVGIYVGLSVMVKRAWPKGWSHRRTGILIFVLALALWSSVAMIDKSLAPSSELSGGLIFEQLSSSIRLELLTFDGADDRPMNEKDISGGYIGAIEYSMLFMLFGYFGAKLIMWVMFAISLMLMTGKSYVEMGRLVKGKLIKLFKLFAAKWNQRAALRAATAAAAARAPRTADSQGYAQDDDAIDEDEDYPLTPRKKKRSLFFSWLQQDKSEQTVKQDDWSLDDEEDEEHHLNGMSPHWAKNGNGEVTAGEWDRNDDPAEQRPILEQDQEHTQETLHNPPDQVPWETVPTIPDPAVAQHQEAALDAPSYPPAPPYAEEEKDEEWTGTWPQQSTEDEQQMEEPSVDFPEDEQLPAAVACEAADTADTAAAAAVLVKEAEPASSSSVPAVPQPKPYMLPPFSLLSKPSLLARGGDGADSIDAKRKLEATLESFGVRAKVLDVVRGPAVTRYEVQPATGVKVSRIVSLTDDIALALAAKDIRMEAPIPGKSAIGIEVPNMEVSVVTMREVMETPAFHNAPSKLSIAFGRDISGQPIIGNLARMPHLLVAGATGSGKSVCINGIITSILYKAKPDEVKFLMVDPKMVELNVYNGIPHLLAPVVTDPRRASLALKKIVVEMEKRYELFSKSATRNIEGYNNLMADNPKAVLPYIVVIVDELADLMMVAAGDVEDSIARLAQMARAAGIHLIIATQRPSVDVITGVIKANIPSRIAFGVSSQVDSRTILDMVGAEKLLGRGDMLFLPVGMSKPLRVQGAFLSDQEVEALVDYSRGQAEAEYKEDLVPEVEEESNDPNDIVDELYDQAVQIVLEAKQASVSLLQRRMRIGYTRAARLIDQMEARSIVGPYEGSKPREVMLTMEQYQAGRISS
ncbi:FtsK/SpoIIIE family DNA translocase [Paenibacillus gorillae]|uniref:FtsK/SpoIIIE family DNA translocase n=1 Tax=Paenibacillus gorillae TaxID=1243662 RepID=UPI0004B488C9|nr:DNA translocase FtsK [Paenibacillus gorillae]